MGLKLKYDANDSHRDFGIYTPPYYNQVSGSGNAGQVLGRILYWWEFHKKKEFFMPLQKLASQLGLTYKEVRTAVKKLMELGFIKTDSRQRGYAPKMTHWTFNEEAVSNAVSSYKAKESMEAIKKATSHIAGRNLNDYAGPTDSPQGRTVCPQGRTDSPQGRIYNNNYNGNLNSSSPPTPSEAQPVPIQEKEEEEIIYIMENEQPAAPSVPLVERPVQLKAHDLPSEKANADELMRLWKKYITHSFEVMDASNSRKLNALLERLGSLDRCEQYFIALASNKYNMGEIRPEYKIWLSAALNPDMIDKFLRGEIKKDREITLTAEEAVVEKKSLLRTQKEYILGKIENSSEPDWVKGIRRIFLEKIGVEKYRKNCLSSVRFVREDGCINILAGAYEEREFLKENCAEIEEALSSVGVVDSLEIWLDHHWEEHKRKSNRISSGVISNEKDRENVVFKAINSLSKSMRLPQSNTRPAMTREIIEPPVSYVGQTPTAVRSALVGMTSRFANRA